jgi:hypothetical protein
MSRIFRDSSVLNQFGSPSLNSNTLANRPAFGQVGRLFVDTTNNVIYRDTGTSWDLIGGGGGSQNLESVTTIGNTTTKGIFAGASGSLTSGFLLEVLGRTKLTGTNNNIVYIGLPSITPNNATFDVFGYSSFRLFTDAASNIGSIMRNDFAINLNANITTGDPSASINQLTLTCNNIASIGNVSGGLIYAGAGLNKNTITDNGPANSPITLTQNSGIFALSPLQSISEYTGLGGTNITHYAGLVINGVKATAGSALQIVNNYQLLINSSEQFSGSTTVSGQRWGIYQAGLNDNNYFGGNVNIGNSTPSAYILDVTGNTIIRLGSGGPNFGVLNNGGSTALYGGYANFITNPNNYFIRCDGSNTVFKIASSSGNMYFSDSTSFKMVLFDGGNINIGGTGQRNKILSVGGEQEWYNITLGTGVHTTSGNHLPIWVNGTQYWLPLLNPPVLP